MGGHRFYRVSMAVFMWLLEGFLGFIGFFYRILSGCYRVLIVLNRVALRVPFPVLRTALRVGPLNVQKRVFLGFLGPKAYILRFSFSLHGFEGLLLFVFFEALCRVLGVLVVLYKIC